MSFRQMQSDREHTRKKWLQITCSLILLLTMYTGLWLGASWARHDGSITAMVENFWKDMTTLPGPFRLFPIQTSGYSMASSWFMPGLLQSLFRK